MKTQKGGLGKNKGIKKKKIEKKKEKKKILVVRMNENKFVGKALMNSIRIRDMSLAIIFKKINDLSVTNSMEEDYQNRGAKCSSGATWGQNNESALKD